MSRDRRTDMATKRERIACPKCGAPMNRHAEKIDTRIPPDGESFAALGVLCEIHTCPRCRFVEERRVGKA